MDRTLGCGPDGKKRDTEIHYRKFGELDGQGSTLGLGCRWFPSVESGDHNLYAYNRGVMHDDITLMCFMYNGYMPAAPRASACIQCGECEAKCSQLIPVREWMPRIHAVRGKGQPYPEKGPGAPYKPRGKP